MSHITNAKTKIKLPIDQPEQLAVCKAWLAQAASVAASQLAGGTVTNYYYSYRKAEKYGCDLAIISTKIERGISIQVNPQTGELYFKGDSYAVEDEVAALQQSVIQFYQALVVRQVLGEMGYNSVDVVDGEQTGQIVIREWLPMLNGEKQVQVTVAEDGTTKFEYSGFVGPKCLQEAQEIQARLAAFGILVDPIETLPKPEMSLVEVENSQGQKQRQGQTGQA